VIRVVVDTNVVVSALLKRAGSPGAVLALIAERRITWCVSKAVLAEYREVLNRPKFRQIDRQKIATLLNLAAAGDLASVITVLSLSPDEPDNRFLECAEAAAAHYLITGNNRDFPDRWKQTEIVTPTQFVRAFRIKSTRRRRR
jgi:uncharacterized protein